MTTDNTETIQAGIDAMLDGNRARFADAVDSIMQDKVAGIIDAMRDDLKASVFDFSDAEEAETEEVEDTDDEESEEGDGEESEEQDS